MALTARIKLPDQVRLGAVIEAQTILDGEPDPGERLTACRISFEGTDVLTADLSSSVAAHPVVVFHLRVDRPGRITAAWTTSKGRVVTATSDLALSQG